MDADHGVGLLDHDVVLDEEDVEPLVQRGQLGVGLAGHLLAPHLPADDPHEAARVGQQHHVVGERRDFERRDAERLGDRAALTQQRGVAAVGRAVGDRLPPLDRARRGHDPAQVARAPVDVRHRVDRLEHVVLAPGTPAMVEAVDVATRHVGDLELLEDPVVDRQERGVGADRCRVAVDLQVLHVERELGRHLVHESRPRGPVPRCSRGTRPR